MWDSATMVRTASSPSTTHGRGATLPNPTMPISGALTIGVPYQPPTAP